MRFLKVYSRVLRLLGSDLRIAALLGCANIVVAGLQFLDPILFGRVIGLLAQSADLPRDVLWHQATGLLAIWAGVGIAGIAANISVAVQAERLAHRHRVQEMGRYFAHVLAMPLSFLGDIHSGRLLKVMLAGTDGLFGAWLVFFRDQLSTIASVFVLLPLTLLINWRLALSLIV
ncbi:MAG: ABC transporter transmembrane domain-containing protein, partial [Acetobacteraceae bacterium]